MSGIDGRASAMAPAARQVEHAYRACERITRRAAANFYYGIRLLPADKRRAMCAVYAFARHIDDIGDGPIEAERKLGLLAHAEESLRALASPDGPGTPSASRQAAQAAHPTPPVARAMNPVGDPVIVALGDVRARFPLPLDALQDLIDGVRMDVQGVSYERFEDLLPYCQRVAGSIGRLCVAIFGASDMDAAWRLADDLGVAMQLTNIVRDVREDAANGRIYLPREDLVRYSLSTDGRYVGQEGQFEAFMRFQAARAREWFDRGMRLIPLLDRRSSACVLAMTGIYRGLLDRIEEHPERAMHERVSLPMWHKALVAGRSLIAAGL